MRLPLDGVGDRAGRAKQTPGQVVDLGGGGAVDLVDDLEGAQGERGRGQGTPGSQRYGQEMCHWVVRQGPAWRSVRNQRLSPGKLPRDWRPSGRRVTGRGSSVRSS